MGRLAQATAGLLGFIYLVPISLPELYSHCGCFFYCLGHTVF